MDSISPPTPMPLADLGAFLQTHLRDSIMPFWLEHAIDPQGGINTCIRDDGAIVNHDKYLWSQWRAVYTFSALYNRIEQRQEWLDLATHILEFSQRYGRDDEGRWIFCVDREGRPLQGATSIYADGFVLLGLTEYIRATGDSAARELAAATFHNVNARLQRPGSYETAPYAIPAGMKAHGVSMIFSFAFFELGRLTGDAAIMAAGLDHANQVMDHFRRPEKQALVEYVRLDGSTEDTPQGRAVVPGHAIESMWFQIQQFQHLGQSERVAECIECIRWHIERGWDPEHGGILLAVDVDGRTPVGWGYPETKLWWPVTEALYALLLAHRICGEDWCLEWYWRVHDVAFRHYPDRAHGEWTQKLDRAFQPITEVVALPVKDPFHLPRSLILSVELLRG